MFSFFTKIFILYAVIMSIAGFIGTLTVRAQFKEREKLLERRRKSQDYDL